MCFKILIFLFFLIQIYLCIEHETKLIVDDVATCPDLPIEKFDLSDIHLKFENRQTFWYGKVIVRGNTIEPKRLVALIVLEKCRNRNSPSTCEKLFDFHIPKPCKALNSTEEVWSSIILKMTPPFQCPLQPGEYVLDGGFLDGKAIKKILPEAEKHYWRIYVKGFDQKELRFCFRISTGFQKFLKNRD